MKIERIINFLVKLALTEDVGPGDITTLALIPREQKAKAVIRAKARGIICGLPVAREVFRHLDPHLRFSPKVKEGALVKPGQVVAEVEGRVRGILIGERTALNFLQHLSGVATLTNQFVKKVEGKKVKILDTRKTIPGLRVLEKYAVRVGGGVNHRLGLYDAILIKDNHLKMTGGIKKAIRKIRSQYGVKKPIEVEAKSLAEVREAIEERVNRILIDNMDLKTLRQAVKLCRKAGIVTEASGKVSLPKVRAIAATGVDYISIGALTHSAPALDLNLKII